MIQQLMHKKEKKEILRKRLISYYDQINDGKIGIPSFLLAAEDIRLMERDGTLDYWYKNFNYGSGR